MEQSYGTSKAILKVWHRPLKFWINPCIYLPVTILHLKYSSTLLLGVCGMNTCSWDTTTMQLVLHIMNCVICLTEPSNWMCTVAFHCKMKMLYVRTLPYRSRKSQINCINRWLKLPWYLLLLLHCLSLNYTDETSGCFPWPLNGVQKSLSLVFI